MNESEKLKAAKEAAMIEDLRGNMKTAREIQRKRQLALMDLDGEEEADAGIHIGDTNVSHVMQPAAGKHKNWLAAILAAILAAAAGGGGVWALLQSTQQVEPITLDVYYSVDEEGNRKVEVKQVGENGSSTPD